MMLLLLFSCMCCLQRKQRLDSDSSQTYGWDLQAAHQIRWGWDLVIQVQVWVWPLRATVQPAAARTQTCRCVLFPFYWSQVSHRNRNRSEVCLKTRSVSVCVWDWGTHIRRHTAAQITTRHCLSPHSLQGDGDVFSSRGRLYDLHSLRSWSPEEHR